MSHCFIKQPNGKWAIWSTVVDNFVLTNASKEEVIKHEIEISERAERRSCETHFTEVEEGRAWTDYKECLRRIKSIHGKKALEEAKKITEER